MSQLTVFLKILPGFSGGRMGDFGGCHRPDRGHDCLDRDFLKFCQRFDQDGLGVERNEPVAAHFIEFSGQGGALFG